MIDGSQPLARARLIAAVAVGALACSRVYRTWTAPELTIETMDGSPVQLSTDQFARARERGQKPAESGG